MLAIEFYKIIQNEETVTNFLIAKNLLVNLENILCNKCDSEMKYYIKKERGKERKLLRCKRKGCQTNIQGTYPENRKFMAASKTENREKYVWYNSRFASKV
ncbi:unnamed protein product [Macrosiphum euphorbiae]|uniref:Uncharacterized protein n=1 Tax=Macrosiphum euphorbiae TaxID=13131 RepID=A0AAV0VI46_9HEMI|nr:unnamed protein product [Macrosiphum euphorbiae]